MSSRLAMEPSEIVKYYKDKSIFITGATGFLGKVLIEKLLRSCPDVKRIYLLVRHKKGNTPQQRVNEILNCPLFEILSQFNPDFRNKLEAIEGDLVLPSMGISADDEQKLVDNINIVFHSAATVRFDEPIKVAVQMNIISTRKVIDLCKRMPNLEAFVHVSTAYANCNRRYVSELVYNAPVHPERIIECTDWISDDLANHITPSIIRPRPNTYTYTKAIAESLVMQECRDQLPCAIVRPSIVGASWREPFPGWIDNFNGPTALFAAIGKGILRTMIGNSNSTADIIPVDFPVNMMIVAAWATAKKNSNKEIRVYNSTTGQINKLTWGMVEYMCRESMSKNPLENIFLVPNPSFTPNRFKKFVRRWIEELLPSYIMDLYLKLIGKKPIFVRLQGRISKAVETLEYFTSTEWEFTNENVFNVENDMNETDRKLFNVNVKEINWGVYIENYCLGVKKYLLKEDISKLNKCRNALANLTRMRNVMFALGALFLLKLIVFRQISFRKFFRFIFMMALSTAVRVRNFLQSKLPAAF